MMMVDYEKTNPNIKRIPVSHAPFPPFSKGAETHFKILKHPLGQHWGICDCQCVLARDMDQALGASGCSRVAASL